MNSSPISTYVVRNAIIGAACIMAFQVAGKAARDALFLTNFRSRELPTMVIGASLIAIALGLLNSRVLNRVAPRTLIPSLMALSSIVQLIEYFAYGSLPRATAVAVYIHVVAIGAVITSGFWSVVNEQLDPHTAKSTFGKVAAAGTVGGILGGFLSERLAALTHSHSVLLLMCVAQLITAALLSRLPSAAPSSAVEIPIRARDVLRNSVYLRSLSLLVVLGTFSAALLDFVLKSEARRAFGPGDQLMRFFAMFHTSTALLAFLVQTVTTPLVLGRWGIGPAIASMPAAVAGGGIIATLTGGFSIVVMVRAAEAVLRASLFRAGYELFYTPMIAAEKRAVKSINDVTIDRLGDGFGGGFSQLVLTFAGAGATPILLVTASISSAVGWVLGRRLNHAYIRTIERSLRHHGRERTAASVEEQDPASLPSSTRSLVSADYRSGVRVVPEWLSRSEAQQYADLLACDPKAFETNGLQGSLKAPATLSSTLLPFVIPMLGRRSTRVCAEAALIPVASKHVGQFADWMLDPQTPLGVRSALPAILAKSRDPRAVEALIDSLASEPFELRQQSALALEELQHDPALAFDPDRIFAIVQDELRKGAPELQHVASLLGLVLPREPVKVAFESLGVEDSQLRGLALEYIETALPPGVSEAILEVASASHTRKGALRSSEEIKTELMRKVGRSA